jgi:two-component system response regulator DegU
VSDDTLRIVIVDDHPIVRAGLHQVLMTAGMTVVAEGANGADALRLIGEVHPDVLVLDVNLPDMSGVEVTRHLRAQGTSTAVLILTVYFDEQTVLGLLDAGAAGYVLKDDAAETLVSAVRVVASGESWLSPRVAAKVMRLARHEATQVPLSPLTPREQDVLQLLAQGLDNEAIAQRLTLTRRTVANHVSTIYSKLGVSSRIEAVLYALNHRRAQAPGFGPSTDAR